MTDRRRRVLGWGTAVLIAALGWAPASGAHAQATLSVDVAGGSVTARCDGYSEDDECTGDGECDGLACALIPGSGTKRYCTAATDIYCCNPDSDDCGESATCTLVSSLEVSICVGDDELCPSLWPYSLADCYEYGDTPVDSWAEGDCDNDGRKNASPAEHGCECDPADMCTVSTVDAGVTTPDAGPVTVDSGTPAFDAGTDAGPPVPLERPGAHRGGARRDGLRLSRERRVHLRQHGRGLERVLGSAGPGRPRRPRAPATSEGMT